MKIFGSIMSFIKSHVIVTIISGVFILGGVVSVPVIVFHNGLKVMNMELEINTEVKYSCLIEKSKNIKIINGEENVDTSRLGKKTIEIQYSRNNNKIKTKKINITIVDTTKPIIDCEDVLEYYIGGEPDFIHNTKVVDNSLEDIELKIEGKYDLQKEGEYPLSFVAVDSSGNKAKKEFLLKVKKVVLKNDGYYVYKDPSYWLEMQFQEDNTAIYHPWFCPGYGCGGYAVYGTYQIVGNKIIAELTRPMHDETESVSGFPQTWEFIYVNENEISMDGNRYIWQSTFTG